MSLNIAVCVKIVPDPGQYGKMRIDPKKHTLIRNGVGMVINTADLHALELALELKERCGGTVTLVSMGPDNTKKQLIEALGYGCDGVVLISDRKFAGADSLATSYTLQKGIEKAGPFDLILLGSVSDDGATAHVPSQLGELLARPHLTNIISFTLEDGEKSCLVKKNTGDRISTYRLQLPCVIGVSRQCNTARYPNVKAIFEAEDKPFTILRAADLDDLDESRIGLAGSPTQAIGFIEPENGRDGKEIEGSTVQEQAANLLHMIHEAVQ